MIQLQLMSESTIVRANAVRTAATMTATIGNTRRDMLESMCSNCTHEHTSRGQWHSPRIEIKININYNYNDTQIYKNKLYIIILLLRIKLRYKLSNQLNTSINCSITKNVIHSIRRIKSIQIRQFCYNIAMLLRTPDGQISASVARYGALHQLILLGIQTTTRWGLNIKVTVWHSLVPHSVG